MPREYNLRKDLPKTKPSKKSIPSKTQHVPTQQPSKKTSARSEPNKHHRIQQSILNAFSDSFSQHAESTALIQELKGYLFNRDFLAAFGRQDLLEVYALRWSASRSLAYFDLFCNCEFLTDALEDLLVKKCARRRGREVPTTYQGASDDTSRPSQSTETITPISLTDGTDTAEPVDEVKVTCLGAGSGAEVVAFAGFLHWLRYGDAQDDGRTADDDPPTLKPLILRTMDVADWSTVIEHLVSKTTSASTFPETVPSPNATTRAPLTDPSHFRVSPSQLDVLSPAFEALAPSTLQPSSLVTLMFTLNELYSTSMSRTTALLLTLTSTMQAGSLLLVVDSPGSYSTVQLNRAREAGDSRGSEEQEKRYPMRWLLDHTLVESSDVGNGRNAGGEKQWEKVHSQDSRWFRLPGGLVYPIEVEDMRFQVHLYRRL